MAGAANGPAVDKLCPHITVTSLEPLDFTDSEAKLICGDPKNPPWSEIPESQARYFLKSFLQKRGYHRLKMTNDANGHLTVDVAGQQLIRKIRLEGDILDIDPESYWLIHRRPLSPANLDGLEKHLKRAYGIAGYPCMRLLTEAYPENESVTVRLEPGRQHEFGDIIAEYIPGTEGGVERRHDAFAENDLYNSMLLDLTASRLMQDDLVLHANFTTRCKGEKITIRQQMMPGEPRLVKFSIGFDTEEYAIASVSFRNSRVGRLASAFYSSLRTSYRHQQATVGFDWFYAPIAFHHFLNSEASYQREFEASYAVKTTALKFGPAWGRDIKGRGFRFWAGFQYAHEESERDNLPATSDINAFHLTVDSQSHAFEYYKADPREGDQMTLDLAYSKKGFGSDFSAFQADLSGTKLVNLFSYEPPVWILGLRYQFSGVSFPHDLPAEGIPLAYRSYLGGSENLRGFGRKDVPEEGALTSAYMGTEIRINNSIPFGLQPIFFADWGKFGGDDFRLTSPSLWSPGFGMHWASPIGVLRFTVAKGYVDVDGDEAEELAGREAWHFYASYGEQF